MLNLPLFSYTRTRAGLGTRAYACARIGLSLKPRLSTRLVLAFLLLLTAVTTFSLVAQPVPTAAATNNTINFQARLQNTTGSIVADGTYDVEFKLYSTCTVLASDGSNCTTFSGNVWTEDHLVTSSQGISTANGYLTTALGSITAFPSTINWDQPLWLTMTVRGTSSCAWAACTPADAEMTPALRLTAVPFAEAANQLQTTSGSNTSILNLQAPTAGNQTFSVLNQGAAGSYDICVQGATNANGGCAPTTGGTGYIQNQNAAQQATSNFWISGTGRADTALQAPSLDVAVAGALSIGGSTATSVSLGKAGITTTNNGALTVTQAFTANGGATINSGTSSQLKVTSGANNPTADQLNIDNTNGGTNTGVVTAGVNALSVNYKGGAAAVEAGAERIDLQPGTTTGGTWNGLRFVANATGPATGVTETGVKLEGPTTGGAGTYNAVNIANIGAVASGGTVRGLNITATNSNAAGTVRGIQLNNITAGAASEIGIDLGTGWDNLLTYNNGATVLINGSGQWNLGQVSGTLAAGNGGTGNAFTAFSGPATSVKTFTLPNASATILTTNAAVTVPQGGTGTNTFTQNGVLYGNGTSAIGATAAGTTGQCLVATTSAAPTWGSCGGSSGSGAIGGSGTLNTIAMFTPDGYNIGNSIITQSGTVISVSGNIDATTGDFNSLNTNGTQRIDSSGNLSSIGTITASGLIQGSGGLSITGNTVLKTTTNSTAAFQVQNAIAAPIFNVGTTDTNLVPNPGGEANPITNWTTYGSNVAISRDTSMAYTGNASIKANVTVSTASVGAEDPLGAALATSTQYTLSFYARLNSGAAFSDIAAAYSLDGTTANEVACGSYNTQTVVTGGWTRVTCTFTTTSTTGTTSAYIVIRQTAAAIRAFNIDAVQLDQAAQANAYGGGSLQLNAAITSPVAIQNTLDSTTAFTVQNASGSNTLFVADTLNKRVGIGTSNPGYLLDVNGSGRFLSDGTNSPLIVDTTGSTAAPRQLTIKSSGQAVIGYSTYPGAWTSALIVQSANNSRFIWASPLDSGSGVNARETVGGTGLDFYTNATSSTAGTEALSLSSGNTTAIGNVTIQGTTGLTLSGASAGITLSGTSPVTIQGTAANGTVNLNANGTGTLSLDTTGAGTINLGTNAANVTLGAGTAAETVNIGNSTGNDTVNIATNTGTDAVNIGTNTSGATTIIQGSTNTGTSVKLQGGASSISVANSGITVQGNITTSGTISTTAGGAAGAGTQTYASDLYIQSRSTNLVTNGTGLLGNNYNFSNFTFDKVNVYSGGGSFQNSTFNANVTNDELIPVDLNSTYQLDLWSEATTYVSGAMAYFGVEPIDIDGNIVTPNYYSKYSGSTDTTLALRPIQKP